MLLLFLKVSLFPKLRILRNPCLYHPCFPARDLDLLIVTVYWRKGGMAGPQRWGDDGGVGREGVSDTFINLHYTRWKVISTLSWNELCKNKFLAHLISYQMCYWCRKLEILMSPDPLPIRTLFWASDWLRQITWPKNLLPIRLRRRNPLPFVMWPL